MTRLGSWADSSILIVDDHEPNVLLLKKLLEASGLNDIEGLTDPRLALRRFDQRRPDLVLLDLHMAHMDGIALMEAMLARVDTDDFVPIIIITADGTPDVRQRALSSGAKDFVTKPFDVTEVVLRVGNLLQSRALHVGLRQHNASLAAELRSRYTTEWERSLHSERRQRIESVLREHSIDTLFQPIVDVRSGDVRGVEALSKFAANPARPPNLWFEEAHRVGLGGRLELLALQTALDQLGVVPEGMFLSVNLSPEAAVDPGLLRYLATSDLERVVIEITEQDRTDSYSKLGISLDELRHAGARVAVDDAGAGFAGLQQILELAPDIIKLDITLTRGIDNDPVRRSLTKCLLAFAAEIGASIVAEGIETLAELETVRSLGVTLGQGYLLGKPTTLANIEPNLGSKFGFQPQLQLN
jgi:EAL domain-containing protein (putative c-di-GMP-specific phosphodiesterase class I)/AmiR/NasT family two-component response regulator